MKVERILVPLDESQLSTVGLDPAYEIARRFGATVQLLMVIDRGATAVLEEAAASEHVDVVRAAEAMLERAASDFQDVATEVEAIYRNDPAHAIVTYARNHPVDLIAMATHGRTGVGRWLMGSVTQKVLGSSPVPVLVVPAPKRSSLESASGSEPE